MKLRNQSWEFRGRFKQFTKGKIHQIYAIALNPEGRKLKGAKSDVDREDMKRNYTKKRVAQLLDDSSYLSKPVGADEVCVLMSSLHHYDATHIDSSFLAVFAVWSSCATRDTCYVLFPEKDTLYELVDNRLRRFRSYPVAHHSIHCIHDMFSKFVFTLCLRFLVLAALQLSGRVRDGGICWYRVQRRRVSKLLFGTTQQSQGFREVCEPRDALGRPTGHAISVRNVSMLVFAITCQFHVTCRKHMGGRRAKIARPRGPFIPSSSPVKASGSRKDFPLRSPSHSQGQEMSDAEDDEFIDIDAGLDEGEDETDEEAVEAAVDLEDHMIVDGEDQHFEGEDLVLDVGDADDGDDVVIGEGIENGGDFDDDRPHLEDRPQGDGSDDEDEESESSSSDEDDDDVRMSSFIDYDDVGVADGQEDYAPAAVKRDDDAEEDQELCADLPEARDLVEGDMPANGDARKFPGSDDDGDSREIDEDAAKSETVQSDDESESEDDDESESEDDDESESEESEDEEDEEDEDEESDEDDDSAEETRITYDIWTAQEERKKRKDAKTSCFC